MSKKFKSEIDTNSGQTDEMFLKWIPNEVFDSFNKDEIREFLTYRSNHYHKHQNDVRIKKIKNQIDKLKTELKERREKVNVYKERIRYAYSKVTHMVDDYGITLEVERRKKYKYNSGSSTRIKWYIKIKTAGRVVIKTCFVGYESDVIKLLGTEKQNVIKNNLINLYRPYVKYKLIEIRNERKFNSFRDIITVFREYNHKLEDAIEWNSSKTDKEIEQWSNY